MIFGAASIPCTGAGYSVSFEIGQRFFNVISASSRAAVLLPVTRAISIGYAGNGFL